MSEPRTVMQLADLLNTLMNNNHLDMVQIEWLFDHVLEMDGYTFIPHDVLITLHPDARVLAMFDNTHEYFYHAVNHMAITQHKIYSLITQTIQHG